MARKNSTGNNRSPSTVKDVGVRQQRSPESRAALTQLAGKYAQGARVYQGLADNSEHEWGMQNTHGRAQNMADRLNTYAERAKRMRRGK